MIDPVKQVAITSNSITIKWTKKPGETYKILWKKSGDSDWSPLPKNDKIQPNASEVTITGLDYSTTYQFKIESLINNVVVGQNSDAEFTTPINCAVVNCKKPPCTHTASPWSECLPDPDNPKVFKQTQTYDCSCPNSPTCPKPKTKICPPVDCKYSDWEKTGTCSKSCGKGSQPVTRTIISEGKYGGTPCQPSNLSKPSVCTGNDCKGTWFFLEYVNQTRTIVV